MTDTRQSSASSSTGSPKPASARKTGAKTASGTKAVAAARKAIEDGTDVVRQQATAALEASAHVVDNAPLSALAGAIALGAVAAALIPSTTREVQALGPVGNRVRGALDVAFTAAKTAGAEQLTARGLTAAATTSGVGALLGGIVKAVLAANGAAKEALNSEEADPKTQPKV